MNGIPYYNPSYLLRLPSTPLQAFLDWKALDTELAEAGCAGSHAAIVAGIAPPPSAADYARAREQQQQPAGGRGWAWVGGHELVGWVGGRVGGWGGWVWLGCGRDCFATWPSFYTQPYSQLPHSASARSSHPFPHPTPNPVFID